MKRQKKKLRRGNVETKKKTDEGLKESEEKINTS